ncbi:hypothetical protein KGF54_005332, partial [Candida jiufengensis]|uniref:uncharacterized protein n=1 Tax=Candida jiufengensis TaxID=497108 RepID=UPI00222504DE
MRLFIFWILAIYIGLVSSDYVFDGEYYFEDTFPIIDDLAIMEEGTVITFYNVYEIFVSIGLIVYPNAYVTITNYEPFAGHFIGDGRPGSVWQVDGTIIVEARNQALINYYGSNVEIFDNNGLTSLYADGQSDFLHVKNNNLMFINSQVFQIEKGLPGLAVFEMGSTGAAQNLGTICLKNTEFLNNMRLEGPGCLVVDNSLVKSLNTNLNDQEHTLYMTNGAKLFENAIVSGTRWLIFGFERGMVISISDTIAEDWSYTSASGVLRITAVSSRNIHSYTIGTGYNAALFRIVDVNGRAGSGITYDGDAPVQVIPQHCLDCSFKESDIEYERVVDVDPDQTTTYVTTYASQDATGIPYLITALVLQSTDVEASMATESYTGVTGLETINDRVTIDGNEIYDVQILRYGFEDGSTYDFTSTSYQEITSYTTTVPEGTAVVMVTSDSINWWYTTTDIFSSYTSTITLNDENNQATRIVYVSTDSEGDWTKSTSTHTPRSQTGFTTYTTTVNDEEVTITGLFEKSTNEAGNWASATFVEVIETTTFTQRIVTEIEDTIQTKDAEIVGYNYEGFGMYYLTSILADPTEARYTTTAEDGAYTGIVRVTSDEENWWYTTTDTLSSYTSTFTNDYSFSQVTYIAYASTDEGGDWVSSTATHTPESQTSLTTYTTIVIEDQFTVTALIEKFTDDQGGWVTTTYTTFFESTTYTERIVGLIDGATQTKDVEVVGYNYDGYGVYYFSSILDDPTETRYTVTEAEFTGIVRVTSDEENWWYTTTDILSSYTSTVTINDDFEQATHIVYASVNEDGEWITSTSTHTPESQTRLTTYTTSVDDEEVTMTGLFEKSTNEAGNWASATFAEVIETTTFTERIVTEIEGTMQTKDAEVIGYNYNGFGMYYLTSILADPTEDRFTVTEAEFTGIVRVTSDEANWWYTTTDILSSYTSAFTINDDFEQATHIVYAFNEDGEWITSTSTHIPESQTRLTTYTTSIDDEEVTITGLFEKSTNEAGNWVSATFAEVIETTTFTERIVTEINGVSQTKDAEVIGYNYNGFGMYYLTSILADPTEARFTVTEADYTGIVRVTSDEENWWYTTTDILSSYTSTYTINDDFEQATHIVYASINEDGEWITSTSTHTPESQTRLTTYTTSIDDEEVTITGLFEKSTNEAGNWVSATFAEVIETTTFTERIVTEINGVSQTKDAEVIGYNYNGFGMYYLTLILADPTEARFTVTEADYTGIVRVTSDEENWWYTTTDILSSYTSTFTINDDFEQATHIVYASVNEDGEWITSTSTHIPESQTRLTTYTTNVDEEEVTMTGLFEKSTNEAGNWVSATFAEVIETLTFTERIVTEIDGVLQTKDAEVIGYNYNGFGMYYLTSILADPTEDRHTVT